jgi:flotillin
MLYLQGGLADVAGSSSIWMIAGAGFVALLVLGMVRFFVSRYRRCPANRVLVVSGRVGGDKAARTLVGGGTFVWPVIQEHAYLDLTPIQISIELTDALSFENIRLAVPSVFTVAIGTEPHVVQNAAIRLLGFDHRQVAQQASEIIFGQMRQVIASMKIDDINRDRDAFLQKIQHSLEPELRKIGLVLINVNIKDLKDSSGYIEAIGKKAASQAVNQALADVAEQEKHGQTLVAQANQEKEVQVANAHKLQEIGVREATREQAVKVATLEKEQQIGEQTAAFEQEVAVKSAEQDKRVRVAQAEATAIAGEAESQAKVAETQAGLAVTRAKAYQLAESRKAEAEAAVAETQNLAQAKAAEAHGKRVEAETRAALEAPAKAAAAQLIVQAHAEAEQRTIVARAEAQAVLMKLEAEAKGQYAIASAKAEAMKKLIDAAAGNPDAAFRLLMAEHLPTIAQTASQAISNIKFDKIVVWDSQNGNATSGFLQGLARSLPPMFDVLNQLTSIRMPGAAGEGDGTVPLAEVPVDLVRTPEGAKKPS